MRIFAILRIAFKALLRNKLRSILTMLGIIIGVGSVITMVSVGKGTGAQMAARIASLGENVITVYAGNFRRGGVSFGMGGAGTLKVDDAVAIRDELVGVKAVSPEVRNNGQVIYNGKNWSTQTYGVDTTYIDIRKWPLQSGAFFTEQEVKQAAKVAIIGSVVTRELFDSGDALGETIRIGNIPFTVIGQLSTKGASLSGSDQDDSILVPYTTAMKRLSRGGGGGFGGGGSGGGSSSGGGGSRSSGSTGGSSGSSSVSTATPLSMMSLRTIYVQAESTEQMGYVQDQITELLRKRHKLSGDDDFSIRNQDEISEVAADQANSMALLLASIAGVSLIVGGIGIMNIMLVSVTERTREIGIRMAVGAKGRDIMMQFLTEACVLSALGGLLGIAIGVGGAHYLREYRNTPTLIPPDWIGYAVAFSAVIGIFFGLYPARKAAKLDPIEALRYE